MTKMLLNNELKIFTERGRDLTQNVTILWATIMGQCSPALQEEISGEPDYTIKSANFNSIWLLQTLQKVTFLAYKAVKTFISHNKDQMKASTNILQALKQQESSYSFLTQTLSIQTSY